MFFVCSLPCRGLLTEPKINMSCTALRELLIRELGQEDATRFSDVHLQNLIDKGYTDHGALKDATRDGLQSPPPLLPALVDKLLKCFKPAGNVHEGCMVQSMTHPFSSYWQKKLICWQKRRLWSEGGKRTYCNSVQPCGRQALLMSWNS